MAKFASIPIEDRIWGRIHKTDSCWEWTGTKELCGYGSISIGSHPQKRFKVHRVVYELLCGLIPDNMEVHHKCRNRLCCNPAHLELLTRKEHANAPEDKRKPKAFCNHGHALIPENVFAGTRQCKLCNRTAKKRWRERKPKKIREMIFCTFLDCNREHYAKGLCAKHYRNQVRRSRPATKCRDCSALARPGKVHCEICAEKSRLRANLAYRSKERT